MIDSNFANRYLDPSLKHFTYDDNPKVFIKHPKSNPSKEDMYKAMESDDWSLRQAVAAHKDADSIVLRSAINDGNIDVRNTAIQNKNLPSELLDKAIHSPHTLQNLFAVRNPNVTKEHLDLMAHHLDERVLRTVAINPKLSPEKHEMLLKDPSEYVQIAALNNPITTDEQLDHTYKTTRNMGVQDAALKLKQQRFRDMK